MKRNRSIRLRGYDYSQAGAYFVTICTQDRACLFGKILNGMLRLNSNGECIMRCWEGITEHFPGVELDALVVMPNHMHGIVVLADSLPNDPERPTLGRIVAYFKYQSTKAINHANSIASGRIWQRNYYERIIRSEQALQTVREYIAKNSLRWEADQLHPDKPSI
jgi:putative transposase